MKSVGIITIHKINNYGSVLQAYALQHVCRSLGFEAEIIDYNFPNSYHRENRYACSEDKAATEPLWIKLIFAFSLLRQHKKTAEFVERRLQLSARQYNHPEELRETPPEYDIYITGSDQVWSPRHCNGDPAFLLHFAPENALKISYAASFGTDHLPQDLEIRFMTLLQRYSRISTREESGLQIIHHLTGKGAVKALDPTLLLTSDEWNRIAIPHRMIKRKYILCYFLNYSFNAFPYVEDLAEHLRKETGYELVRVARPPHSLKLCNNRYRIGASPEEFISLIRDAEMVLTTSFHGTAFAINFGKPLLSIVRDAENDGDNRQTDLMKSLGLHDNILSLNDSFPSPDRLTYNTDEVLNKLSELRKESIKYLTGAIRNE